MLTLYVGHACPGQSGRSRISCQEVAYDESSLHGDLPGATDAPIEKSRKRTPPKRNTVRSGGPARFSDVRIANRDVYRRQLPRTWVIKQARTRSRFRHAGGGTFVMVPVLTSVNLPAAGIGILLALDTIPDMFRTAANVTGWLCAGTIVSRCAEGATHGDAPR